MISSYKYIMMISLIQIKEDFDRSNPKKNSIKNLLILINFMDRQLDLNIK